MKNDGFDRRAFLKSAVAGSAAAATVSLPRPAEAQPAAAAPASQGSPAPNTYAYLNPDEAAFVEALVDHMVPADQLTPKGTELGLNTYIDRALAGGWGKGDRLYMQGPWKQGVPSQGYQLPLTPAELYRAGIAAANAFCVKTYGKSFDKIGESQRQEFLVGLQAGKVAFENGPPARVFFATIYQNVMEGMFSDPIYGGNRNKAGWKMIGFPGVIAVHYQNVEKYRDKKYTVDPVGISDMS
ncbi:MAG TPA: gluconate 2-dehydrogenase subunit 3 family protein [Burkholderiales bacterium]|jgi:gluconate 2-dehydrogenase gamma chain|nr:gluconate 2-dehydrogenase subunit 3 family protein [Burkholderiales bacterium]